MNRILISTTLGLAAVTPLALPGADFPDDPNRISLGARFGMNFKADFHNNASVNPGPLATGANHAYNDGYVLVDSSGNAGGMTWNWGYQNPGQVVGDSLQFHAIDSSVSSATSANHVTDDPQFGAE